VTGVTADSNIYISALHFGGEPRRFLTAAQRGRFQLAISPALEAETQRVLRIKFLWFEVMLQHAFEILSRFNHPRDAFAQDRRGAGRRRR
jgi:hypothetical protein